MTEQAPSVEIGTATTKIMHNENEQLV